jgi:DNA-binding transcriptional ArsR family regulator
MAISKHVRVLVEAGVVEMEPEGRVHWCRVREEALKSARDWLDHHGMVAARSPV